MSELADGKRLLGGGKEHEKGASAPLFFASAPGSMQVVCCCLSDRVTGGRKLPVAAPHAAKYQERASPCAAHAASPPCPPLHTIRDTAASLRSGR